MAEKLIEAIGFVHNGKNYVIKVIQIGNKFTVIPYLNGIEASFYPYSVVVDSLVIDTWKYHYGNEPPYVRLVEIVKQDIQKGYGVRNDIKP